MRINALKSQTVHTPSDVNDTELPGGFFAAAEAAAAVGAGLLGTVSTGLEAMYLMNRIFRVYDIYCAFQFYMNSKAENHN